MKSIFCFALLGLLPGVAAQTNVALGRPTEASPTIVHASSVAVNGDTSGNNFYHSQDIPNAFWQVEISSTGDVCEIDQIKVWDRLDSAYWSRMAGYEIEFWNGHPTAPGSVLVQTSAPMTATPGGRHQTLNFAPVKNVRWVRITKAPQGILTLSQVEIFGTCGLPPSAGLGGDPHIKLWSGESYDFHGHCDLLLLDTTLANGDHLTIQVRSSPYKEIFSYVSEAAIQIGDRVLTIGPGGQHTIDGVPQVVGKTGALVIDELHQYPVESSKSKKKPRHVYKVFLGNGPHGKEEIDIREFKDWITVTILHPSYANLEKSVGMLGRFPDGALLGRDGKTIHTSYDVFGQEWQVPPGESLLGPGPFSENSCAPLQALTKLRGRRLRESSITRAQAAKACQHWGDQMEDCIRDVQISEDLEMADTLPL